MSNIVSREFLIYRHVDAQLKLKGMELEGDLNKIICNEVEKLSFALTNLLEAAGISTEFTSYVKYIESSKILVGKIIRINSNEKIDVEQLIQNFLIKITLTDNTSQSLLNPDLIQFDDIIENEASKFLLKNENKHIKQGLEVKSDSFLFKMEGKFSRIENKETSLGPAFSWNGTVIGMFKPNRTAHFKSTTNTTIVAYYMEKDFHELNELFKNDAINKFTFQMKYDPMGKKDFELLNLEAAELKDDYPLI